MARRGDSAAIRDLRRQLYGQVLIMQVVQNDSWKLARVQELAFIEERAPELTRKEIHINIHADTFLQIC